MNLKTNLYNLSYMLPSQYHSTEKMRGKGGLKKDVIAETWKKIIIEGLGFEGATANIGEELKSYLKGRCISKQIGNYTKFCRKWCEEILSNLEIKDQKEIERIYAIFNLLGKEYLEADTFGVRPTSRPVYEYEYMLDTLSNIKTFSGFINHCSTLFDRVCAGLTRMPWWVSATLSTFSRYRTVRQCLVGTKVVAATLKKSYSGFEDVINEKFNAFKNTQACTAKATSQNEIVDRDISRKMEDIKKITSERLGSLIFKVTVAASIFSSILYFTPDLIGLSPLMAFPGMLYNENIWHGALPAMCAMACTSYVQAFLGGICIPLLLTGVYLSLALASPAILLSIGPLMLAMTIASIVMVFMYDEMLNIKAASRFFNDAPWHPTDYMTMIGLPLSKGIDYALDKILFLIDGNEQPVNIKK